MEQCPEGKEKDEEEEEDEEEKRWSAKLVEWMRSSSWVKDIHNNYGEHSSLDRGGQSVMGSEL